MSTQPEEIEDGEIVSDEYETEDEISVDDQEILEDLEDLLYLKEHLLDHVVLEGQLR